MPRDISLAVDVLTGFPKAGRQPGIESLNALVAHGHRQPFLVSFPSRALSAIIAQA
jgi:hypothetical protein